MASATDSAPGSRIAGLDLARGLAILGMLAAHTIGSDEESFYDGRSSVLFAVLAGVSLGLMTGGAAPLPLASRRRARLSIAIRGLLLLALGLGLWMLETPVAIILDTYGLLFLAALPVLFASRATVALLAVGFAFAGPPLVGGIRAALDDLNSAPHAPWLDGVAAPFDWFTSYYAAPVWIAYVLAGIALARSDLRAPRTQLVAIVGGALSALAGYGLAATTGSPVVAHDDSTFEVFGAGGVAFAVIGTIVWLTSGTGARLRGAVVSVFRPLAAAGSMPLTVYTAQILAIAAVEATGGVEANSLLSAHPLAYFGTLAVGSLLFAALWSLRFSQGPLEWLMARLSLRRPWRSQLTP